MHYSSNPLHHQIGVYAARQQRHRLTGPVRLQLLTRLVMNVHVTFVFPPIPGSIGKIGYTCTGFRRTDGGFCNIHPTASGASHHFLPILDEHQTLDCALSKLGAGDQPLGYSVRLQSSWVIWSFARLSSRQLRHLSLQLAYLNFLLEKTPTHPIPASDSVHKSVPFLPFSCLLEIHIYTKSCDMPN